MKFDDLELNSLYKKIYSTEAHFIFPTNKTGNNLYGIFLYASANEVEIYHRLERHEIDDISSISVEEETGSYGIIFKYLFGDAF